MLVRKSSLRKSLSVLLMAALATWAIAEEEYFGSFNGEPSFEVKANKGERPTFVLKKDFEFKDPNGFRWVAPAGTEVDGASIPQLAWTPIGGPMSGNYLHASIIHDYYCQTKERTSHDTHRNFYYGMRAKNVPGAKAKFMYWVVQVFGPSWKIRIVTNCIEDDSGVSCEDTRRTIDRPGIDLSEVAQLNLAKALSDDLLTGSLLCEDCLGVSSGSGAPGLPDPEALEDATLDQLDRSALMARTLFGVPGDYAYYALGESEPDPNG